MERIKKTKEWIVKNSPGYENTLEEERTKTSKMLYARRRVSFTRIFAPGIHLEAEEYILDKRLKGGIFRNFRYFGPRGEFLFYFFFALCTSKIVLNNINRELTMNSILNDRNVYNSLELPFETRKIN
jgi:hypothetical protein